ncbi:MAG: ACP S-malonyltransferase, partial [Lentisphaerae bacterium]|nr:ACP S-malonyltransferase [Lentisphaerota bacterium]
MNNRKIACIFAGQGAQYTGMGKDFFDSNPKSRAMFEEANEILGFDIAKLCFEGPDSELVRSEVCQPAIFLVSTACFNAFIEKTSEPDFAGFAGLSLGEWSALHAAGAISFEDCLKALAARGRFMQEACDERPGAMLSIIGMSDENIVELAKASGSSIANLNSPGQTVLSGKKEAIAKAQDMA